MKETNTLYTVARKFIFSTTSKKHRGGGGRNDRSLRKNLDRAVLGPVLEGP